MKVRRAGETVKNLRVLQLGRILPAPLLDTA